VANDVVITVKGRDQGGKQTITETGRSLQRVGEIAQGIIVAQMFQKIGESATRFLGQAKSAASNLGESANAVSVVFKEQSQTVLKWGQDNASSFGLSKRAFNEAITPMGAMLKNTGLDMETVSSSTIDLTTRAADMASVFNTDVSEALLAIQAGLRGEADPLERFGVGLNAAAVEARALADTGKSVSTELTTQEKMLARIAIIMEQTNDVAGDFSNTSDSLANQQRILNAELENSQAVMGQALIPAFQLLNEVLLPVLTMFQGLPGPVQTVISVLIVLAAAILAVSSRIAPMIISMQAAGVSMNTMTAAAGRLTAALGPVALIITGLIFAQKQFEGESIKAQTEVGKLAEDLDHLTRTGRVNTELWALFGDGLSGAADNTEFFGEKLDLAAEKSSSFGAKAKEVWDVFQDGDNAMQDAAERFEQLDDALAAAVESGADGEAILQSLIDTYGLTAEQVEKLRTVLPEYAKAQERAGESTDEATAAVEEQIGALDELAGKLKAQTDPLFGFIDANDKATAAQDALREAEEEFGAGSPEYERALLDLAKANLDLFGATTDASGQIDGTLIPSLRRARDAGIITEEEFDALVGAIKEVDRTDATITVRDNAAQALRRQQNLRSRLRNIDRFINYTFRTVGAAPAGALNTPNAHGGIAGARGMQDGGISGNGMSPLEVNERGEELARVPTGDLISLVTGSTVIPHGQSQALLDRHGGGTEVVVRFEFVGADEEFAEFFRRIMRRRPGLVAA
jgi:hypothetical protein